MDLGDRLGIDVSPLGVLCAQVMEQIAEEYGDDAVVRTAAVVVEIETEGESRILVACNEPRAWVQLAFLDEGHLAVERGLLAAERGEEP